MLRHCLPQNVTQILTQLPASLDETYARVLKEVGKTIESYARRLLQCMTVAKCPLTVEELGEVLALDFGTDEGIPVLKENLRWEDQQEAMLSMCSSLIVVVDFYGEPVVQFSHFSVKEFLTSDRLANSSADISLFHILPKPAHTVMVKACLGILLQPEQRLRDAPEEHLSPLTEYAAKYWMYHAQFEEVWGLVEDQIRSLFDPEKPHLEGWLKFYTPVLIQPLPGFSSITYRGSPLFYASLFGFLDLTAQLIAENPQDVTGEVCQKPTPLVGALLGRHFDVADLLYQAGADLCIRGYGDMTLLHAASSGGFVDVAKWLFDHGVSANSHTGHPGNVININVRDDRNNTPLQLASKLGHSEIVDQLLVRGADISVQDESHRMPLHLASHILASAKLRLA